MLNFFNEHHFTIFTQDIPISKSLGAASCASDFLVKSQVYYWSCETRMDHLYKQIMCFIPFPFYTLGINGTSVVLLRYILFS